MRRRTAAAVATVALLAAAPQAGAALRKGETAAPAVREPVVAVIDTGLRATHQEFDYRGPSSTSDQLVGWWDFTSETKDKIVLPEPGESWDTAVRDPYDKNGHGTATASMAVGRNIVPQKTPSALPGGKLAIAKVGNGPDEDVEIEGDIGKAVRWATDTVRADVINISIGTIVPWPAAAQRADYDAIRYARSKGVLVVVSNGNGWGNAGFVPGDPGWASGYSSSTQALTVGASGANGYLVSTDPEVSAQFTVLAADKSADNAYASVSGTSFGAPFVAGFAAAALQAAYSAGRDLPVERLEQLVKQASKDTVTPAPFEGYGTLSPAELASAQAHARNGTLPTRPSPDLSATYVESVAGELRSAWSD